MRQFHNHIVFMLCTTIYMQSMSVTDRRTDRLNIAYVTYITVIVITFKVLRLIKVAH